MKQKLVVLFGGRSAEHDVSCVSAVAVLASADRSRYDIVPVGVTRAGKWVLAADTRAADPGPLEPVGPPVDPFDVLRDSVVLPLLHGPFGEDGTVQGLCEVAGVPYVGSGVLGSAAAMDKLVAKQLLSDAGIPVAPYLGVRERDYEPLEFTKRVDTELAWPVFVKPANLGSSIGVTKVDEPAVLAGAVGTALQFDEWVIVETAIFGREIECGVLDELGDGGPVASVPGEVCPAREFYDYEDKYLDGRAELRVPAPLPPEVAEEVRRLAVEAFCALRGEGMARVDFFYEESSGRILVNEANTIPGFTPISMFPRMWEASGLSYTALIDRLVDLAVERHARRSAKSVTRL